MLFCSMFGRYYGRFIGEQLFVTIGMDTLAIPADSIRISKRFIAIDTILHCQPFVFLALQTAYAELPPGPIGATIGCSTLCLSGSDAR